MGPDLGALLPPLPGWIAGARAETLDSAAFRSGAALAHLHLIAASVAVPQALWRDRLALRAAEVSAGLAGRREGVRALRDAVHLTRAGDDPGPAGNILRHWSRAVARPISVAGLGPVLGPVLESIPADLIADCLDQAGATPVDRAAGVLEAVLEARPRAETAALILAEAALARAMGWGHLLPLLSLVVTPRDLRLRGDGLRLACHRAVAAGAAQAVPLAGELARAAARLRAVLPRLRAKGAGRAAEMFLTHEALAPGALNFMSDRAGRRLCDRLVAFGALHELTGRDSFRLYGLLP
jgi:hypothetical protein